MWEILNSSFYILSLEIYRELFVFSISFFNGTDRIPFEVSEKNVFLFIFFSPFNEEDEALIFNGCRYFLLFKVGFGLDRVEYLEFFDFTDICEVFERFLCILFSEAFVSTRKFYSFSRSFSGYSCSIYTI